MLRVGNCRAYALTDASARLTAMLSETGPDGQHFRWAIDRSLQRDSIPYFPMTWTLMHALDNTSPLHQLRDNPAMLDDLQIMLSISARDPSLDAQVYASQSYRGPDIAMGQRYADAVTFDGKQRIVADMRLISAIEPDPDS